MVSEERPSKYDFVSDNHSPEISYNLLIAPRHFYCILWFYLSPY